MSADEQFHDDEGESLVAAMTRPTMVGGLTLASLAMSFYFPGMAAMIARSVWPAIAIPFLLLGSYLVCLKDVYLFDILAAATHLKVCPNNRFWGCRRYAPR
ncbi:type IV secretory pathway, VirB3 protein (plasmid) [Ralstonia solanacearum CMR15]|uniref:VirB3 family type IV secretion system protein n=1 Tax=Ralstonia pseudosolanacearum TaxID=1310165 RepID=UPI0001D95BF2|nr:VirB3 family type IV secretion system protein [Ralstonia pseudosolanacearum]CBJ36151.1 type IV secretory pathway, VirB3 protein [Ralstonia solanacearum CMR15]HDR9128321.1 VirB3 family type IV secretion system protein [Burkholderia vietnamiensis]